MVFCGYMKSNRVLVFAVSLALAFSAAAIGGYFTSSSVTTWYVALAKPMLNPPSWVFAPVWTLLYALMAIAAALVYERSAEAPRLTRQALAVYGVQLVLNALWSYVFFGMRDPALALVVIAGLWLSIVSTVSRFSKINRTSAWLMMPYLAWVSFASYLNLMVAILNP